MISFFIAASEVYMIEYLKTVLRYFIRMVIVTLISYYTNMHLVRLKTMQFLFIRISKG